MKQKILFLCFCLLSVISMNAAVISEEEAIEKAKKLMPNKRFLTDTEFRARSNTRKQQQTLKSVPFYIINAEDDGFVIVSGDDRVKDILGYSEHGNLDRTSAPTNVQWLLNSYEDAIKSVMESDGDITSDTRSLNTSISSREEIEPLITTTWGQGTPYNALCPTFGEQCLTGCVATAMAQVINYWKWPVNGTNIVSSYSTATNKIFMPELPSTSFDWDDMTNNDIARLMLYCGQSVEMDYGVEASGAGDAVIPSVLENIFGYSNGGRKIERRYYTDSDWYNIIYEELQEKHPVLYSGVSGSDSHMFICHGYKEGRFYINWGWNGDYDGYFDLSLLNPSNYSFSNSQVAIIGIEANGEAKGSEVIADQNLHLYFTINKDTREAVVGTGVDEDIAGAICRPPLGDDWWETMENLWADVVIPSTIVYNNVTYTVTGVAQNAFIKNTDVQRVTLPETIRSIGESAFYWCVNLESINIPDQVDRIAPSTFVLCRKLKELYLPKNIKSIGGSAFSDCQGLKEIIIPGKCTSIGNEAFKWCVSLSKLIIEDGSEILNLGYTHDVSLDYAGQDAPRYRGLFADCPIKNLYIGRTLGVPEVSNTKYPPFYSISNYCTNTTGAQIRTGKNFSNVEFGNTVTTIPDELFWLCWIKNEIQLPANLNTIGNRAFYNESGGDGTFNQTTLIFPPTLESIGDNAFANCTKLKTIRCQSSTPPVIGNYTYGHPFWNCNIMFVVPDGAGSNYREDENWSVYSIYDPGDYLYTVNVKTAGTLYDRLLAQDAQISKTYRLKIKGTLNSDDWTVLSNMSNLHDIDMSELMTEQIPDGLFSYKNSLVNVILPNTLTSIQDNAFNECTHLSGVLDIPAACTSIGNAAFYKTGIDGINYSGKLSIGSEAFRQCYNLKTINIIGEGTGIGYRAFWGSGVKKLCIGQGVDVGSEAFYYCSNLEEIELEDGVNSISDVAFGSCQNLLKVSFNGLVGHIGNKIFNYCENLKEINIKDVGAWCQLEFPNKETSPLFLGASLKLNGDDIINIVISDEVQKIANYAFYGCTSIESIELGTNLTNIGDYAFYGCSNLKNVKFSSNLSSIGVYAFDGCTSIVEMDFPLCIQSIGSYAFRGCTSLEQIVAHWDNPFSVNENTFSDVSPSCYLYVPIGCATKYTLAGWTLPNMKAVGILSIKTNSGGTVSCNDVTITNDTKQIFFTPYKSFNMEIVSEDGFYVKKIKLNNDNVTSQLNNGKLYIEEPEENVNIIVVFADENIVMGDANGDSEINSQDVIDTANHVLKNTPGQFYDYATDMNDDDIINITDLIMIKKIIQK